MAKRKEYDRVIIVDENGRPMSWSGEQLCYCTDEYWQDKHHPVRSYTIATAKRHIAKSIKNRSNIGRNSIEYKTMPFAG